MAIGSLIYNFEISLSDTDKDVYDELKIRVARHSSETLLFMLCRVLAFCLEYTPELQLTKGLDEPELPAICARDLTGRLTKWIEVGTPSAEKLHKASKSVKTVVIYTHKNPENLLQLLENQKIHRASDIKLYSFEANFLEKLSEFTERTNKWSVSINDGVLYIDTGSQSLHSGIKQNSLVSKN